jgi:site-specific DNA-methyltransferase (adenine-specific)/modification methylase
MAEKVVIGNAELWHGDCREVLPMLQRHDLLLTDPPYGIGINKSNRLSVSRGHVGETWDDGPIDYALMAHALERAHDAIVWGGNYYVLGACRCFLVWDKQNDGRDFADCEMAWTSLDSVARIFRKRPMNMDGGKEHPTQKPIDLMVWCLDKARSSDSVLDPFMGSGTTGVACAQLGKSFTGIERERKYFDIACERISRAQAQGQMFPAEQQRQEQQLTLE